MLAKIRWSAWMPFAQSSHVLHWFSHPMRAVVTSQVSRNECSEAPRSLQLCISVFDCLRCIQQRKVTTNTRIVQRSMCQVTGDTSSCISKLQSSKKSTWFGKVLWCGAWMVHSDPTILTTRLRWASDNPTRSLNINHHWRSKSSCPVPKFDLCYTASLTERDPSPPTSKAWKSSLANVAWLDHGSPWWDPCEWLSFLPTWIPRPSISGAKWFLKGANLPSVRVSLAPLGRCW